MGEFDLQQWEVEGTIISPLHIGSGESLDPFRIVQRGDMVYEFDLSMVLNEAHPDDRSELERTLSQPEVNPDFVVKKLREIVKEKHFIPGRSYKLASNVQIKEDMSGEDIMLFSYNTLTGERIVPGSSLKGALRTGMIADREPRDFRPSGSPIQRAQGLEKAAMRYNKIDEDPFGEWYVSDAVIDADFFLGGVSTHHRLGTMTPPIPNIFEMAQYNYEKPAFNVIFNHRKRKRARGRFNLNEWLKAVNKNTQRAFDEAYPYDKDPPGSFPIGTADNQEKIYDKIEACQDSSDSCVVRLGRFSGYLAMTVENQRSLQKRTRGWLRGKQADPLTRVLTSDGWPMGFVKLKFNRKI